jgi:hypothetical protein
MEEADEQVRDSYQQAEDMEQVEKVQVLDELLEEADEDPDLKAKVIEKLSEE